MIRVVIYNTPTEWIIKEIARSRIDRVREVLTAEGHWFVFTETDEH